MRFAMGRVAPLAALAAAATTAACTSTVTQRNIEAAEGVAEVRARAPAAAGRVERVPPGEQPAAAPLPDEAALAGPIDLPGLEATVLARHPSLVAAAHRVRALGERARAEGSLPPPELGAEVWQVPFVKPYALDKSGMIM